MKMTLQQKERLVEFLSERWPEPQKCWICGEEDWAISERLFEIREHGGRSIKLDGATVPVVLFTCPSCGNSVMFNGVAMGLFQRE